MNKTISLLLALALLPALLSACRPQPDDPSPTIPEELSCAQLLNSVWMSLGIGLSNAEIYGLAADDGAQRAAYIEGAYGLAEGEWEDAAIARETGASAVELTVLRFAGEDAAKHGEDCLKDYLHAREGDFTGYAPGQAKLVADAELCRRGLYVGLFVCQDSEFARAAFTAVLETGELPEPTPTPKAVDRVDELPSPSAPTGGRADGFDPDYPHRVLFTPPNKDDMSIYDTSAIRAAWETGDPAGLSGNDRAVYDAAQQILGEVLTDGMTDLEKETAIYAWLVNNVDYDWTHQNILAATPRTSFEPYGGLVDHTAVCLGYATSFQLLMDLAGVECITVVGAAFNSAEDHGWNMVRLDGKWYCVDVTWDANGREQMGNAYTWCYFNVTSDEMARNHQWDYANTPEAVG